MPLVVTILKSYISTLLKTLSICVINKIYFLLKGTMNSIVILTICSVSKISDWLQLIQICSHYNHENWTDFLEHTEVITYWGAAVLMNYNITSVYCVRRILTLLENLMIKPHFWYKESTCSVAFVLTTNKTILQIYSCISSQN